MFDTKFVSVRPDNTDEELLRVLKDVTADVLRTNEPYELLIDCYDDNPIPLWAIEGAAGLCERLVRLGFMSPLKMVPEPGSRDMMRGWTAYEVWLCSRRELGPDIALDRMAKDVCGGEESEFIVAVSDANKLCDRLVGVSQ
jgi:hypothetical protein